MSTVTFPWQHNGFQALFIQKVNSEFSVLQEVLFARVVHSVGVSKYGHHTAQAQESPLDSGATNKAFLQRRGLGPLLCYVMGLNER